MSSVRQLVKKFKDMPYNKRQGLVILGIVIVLISIPVTISLIRQNPQFTSKAATVAQFVGTPTSPEPFTQHPDYQNFDVQVHSRDQYTWCDDCLESMQADHGTDCGANADNSLFPTHEVHSYADTVFICKNHLMTALLTSGYGMIYLTPNKILDWSHGTAQFSFEVSTHMGSARDWWDLWLQEYDGNNAVPLEHSFPDEGAFLGYPPVTPGKHYLHIQCGDTDCAVQNDQEADTGIAFGTHWKADSKATRDRYVLTIDSQKYSFCKVTGEPDGQPVCWATNTPHHLGNVTQAIVQIGQHSYNPMKECTPYTDKCAPGIWHWSNIGNGVGDGPFIPFTIIHSTPRAITGTGGTVHFTSPAPANSFLRFAAMAQVTVNGQHVNPVVDRPVDSGFNGFWVPIPQGTQDVTIGLSPDPGSWYNCQGSFPCQAQDFAIWSTTASGGGTTCTKQADLNCDNLVNILDLSILLSKWNTTDATSDINHDGKVSVFDLSILLSKWGS